MIIAFFLAQAVALGAGAILLGALGATRLPAGLFVLAAWLGGSGALAAERLLLAQAGLPWTAGTLIPPWVALGGLAAWRIRREWRSGLRSLRATLTRPIPFGAVIEVGVAAGLAGWTAALWWQATNT